MTFQTMTYTFTGLPEVLLQFAQQISGATGIPLVRLFGQSPVGFNSTGESDIRLYYDNTKQQQEKMLRPGLKKILNVIYMSVTGHAPDKDFNFDFRPLWQMTNEQKGAYATAMVGAIVQALQSESIPLPNAMKELKKLSPTIGLFSSITEEDIDEAEKQENELMPPEAGGLNAQQNKFREQAKTAALDRWYASGSRQWPNRSRRSPWSGREPIRASSSSVCLIIQCGSTNGSLRGRHHAAPSGLGRLRHLAQDWPKDQPGNSPQVEGRSRRADFQSPARGAGRTNPLFAHGGRQESSGMGR